MNPETIAALTAFVVALGALYVSINNSRAASAAARATQDANAAEAAATRKAVAEAATEAKAAAQASAAAQEAAEVASRKIVATADGIYEVGTRLDGRLSALVTATQRLALAEGRAEGVAAEQERVASGAASITPAAASPPPPPQEPMTPINGIPDVPEPKDTP